LSQLFFVDVPNRADKGTHENHPVPMGQGDFRESLSVGLNVHTDTQAHSTKNFGQLNI